MAETKTPRTAKTETKIDYRSREHRKPLNAKQLRMQVDKEAFTKAGLRPFWALDNGNRIKQLIESGYRFVSSVDDVVVEQDERDGAIYIEAAGKDRHTGKPINQYLMAIPLDLYHEDQAARREKRDRVKKAQLQGRVSGGLDAQDNIRVGRGDGLPDIRIEDGRKR